MIVRAASRAAERALPSIPAALDAPVGTIVGSLAWAVAGAQRRAVRANLAVVAPERAARGGLDRAVFIWQVRHYVELFRLAEMPAERAERTIRVTGWERFTAARARGRGVILASAHLGPVSVCGQVLAARGIEITMPIERTTSEFWRAVNRARAGHGIHFVPVDAALGIYRVLRDGGVLGIMGDRAITGTGVRVPFFGREALLPSAAVVLALRTGAALVPAFASRERDRLVASFGIEIALARSGDHEADVREGIRRYAEQLEAAIARAPEEWSVFEPVWER